MTSSGIKPPKLLLAAQCLNPLRYRVSRNGYNKFDETLLNIQALEVSNSPQSNYYVLLLYN
jgi:hypothetical protein